MAKNPVEGDVKTRLVGSVLNSHAAAEVAFALLRCTCQRLRLAFPFLALAVSPDDAAQELAERLEVSFDWVGGQGIGDLGDRIACVARDAAGTAPVAFFGMDSPDIPCPVLIELCDWLSNQADDGEADDGENIAVGPTPDGGYWVLAARLFDAAIVCDIDWGTGAVYDQTCTQIRDAGLRLRELPMWDDIDEIDDLIALNSRLTTHDTALDPHLSALHREIRRIIGS